MPPFETLFKGARAAESVLPESVNGLAHAAIDGLLAPKDYLSAFQGIQTSVVGITEGVARTVKPGEMETAIASRLTTGLAKNGLTDHWYPILVNAGENSGKPLSRRFHLPSEQLVRDNDIVIVDSTPIVDTVWGNWTKTVAVGNDPFYRSLAQDTDILADETFNFANRSARNVGDIYDYSQILMKRMNFISLDPRNDVGHSIFQVPKGQTVELTPLSQRLFINDEYRRSPITGILSIEPQVGRINPADGIMYGAKQQRVLIRE
jgi:hypothetical protein